MLKNTLFISIVILSSTFAGAVHPAGYDVPIGLIDDLAGAFEAQSTKSDNSAVRMVVHDYLFSKGPDIADKTYLFLSRNERWFDFSDLALEIARFEDERKYDTSIVHSQNLRMSNLDTRKDLYRQAMTDGGADMPWGGRLSARKAAYEAAMDGLTDLRDLITTTMNRSDPMSHLSIAYLKYSLNLRRGASSREQAEVLAAKKILEMEPSAVSSKIETDSDFKRAVLDAFSAVGEMNPMTGAENPSCHLVTELFFEQMNLKNKATEAARASSQIPQPAPALGRHWLDAFRSIECDGDSVMVQYVRGKDRSR